MPNKGLSQSPSANQGPYVAKSRRGHVVCTLWVYPPTSPCHTIAASIESKDIAGSDIMNLKVSHRMKSLSRKGLISSLSADT